MKVEFELTGTMAMLMHWDNIEGGDELKVWRQDPKNKNQSVAGDDRSPPWTWHTYLYNDGEYVTIPQDNIMATLMYGGVQVTLKKQKTFKELSQSAILIDTEHCRFEFGNGNRLSMAQVAQMRDMPFIEQAAKARELGFRLFIKRAKIGNSKHVRVRPRFDSWKVTGSLAVTSPDITFPILQTIFSYAGHAGIGDWRPNSPKRPGPYGQYEAKLKLLK